MKQLYDLEAFNVILANTVTKANNDAIGLDQLGYHDTLVDSIRGMLCQYFPAVRYLRYRPNEARGLSLLGYRFAYLQDAMKEFKKEGSIASPNEFVIKYGERLFKSVLPFNKAVTKSFMLNDQTNVVRCTNELYNYVRGLVIPAQFERNKEEYLAEELMSYLTTRSEFTDYLDEGRDASPLNKSCFFAEYCFHQGLINIIRFYLRYPTYDNFILPEDISKESAQFLYLGQSAFHYDQVYKHREAIIVRKEKFRVRELKSPYYRDHTDYAININALVEFDILIEDWNFLVSWRGDGINEYFEMEESNTHPFLYDLWTNYPISKLTIENEETIVKHFSQYTLGFVLDIESLYRVRFALEKYRPGLQETFPIANRCRVDPILPITNHRHILGNGYWLTPLKDLDGHSVVRESNGFVNTKGQLKFIHELTFDPLTSASFYKLIQDVLTITYALDLGESSMNSKHKRLLHRLYNMFHFAFPELFVYDLVTDDFIFLREFFSQEDAHYVEKTLEDVVKIKLRGDTLLNAIEWDKDSITLSGFGYIHKLALCLWSGYFNKKEWEKLIA